MTKLMTLHDMFGTPFSVNRATVSLVEIDLSHEADWQPPDGFGGSYYMAQLYGPSWSRRVRESRGQIIALIEAQDPRP